MKLEPIELTRTLRALSCQSTAAPKMWEICEIGASPLPVYNACPTGLTNTSHAPGRVPSHLVVITMPQPFSRTLRSLDQERTLLPWLLTLSLLGALIAWIFWAFTATFPVIVTSSHATLVTTSPLFHLQAPERRRVLTAQLATSRRVRADEVLVTFDASPELLERDHHTELLRLIQQVELPALALQRELIEASIQGSGGLTRSRRQQGEAQLKEVEIASTQAQTALERQERLLEAGVATAAQVEEQRALSARLTQSAARWQATLRTLHDEHLEQTRSLQGLLAEIDRERATLERERERISATLRQLDYQIALYTLRAPSEGELHASRQVHPGMWIERGETIAWIVPDAPLEVRVDGSNDQLATRVEPGMMGTLALDAYPWMEFGKARVVVREVSNLPSEGVLLMRLDLLDSSRDIPLKHGLTGEVELEIERLTPATMIARHVMRQRLHLSAAQH